MKKKNAAKWKNDANCELYLDFRDNYNGLRMWVLEQMKYGIF